MNAARRLSQAWLWPLLALSGAGSGVACSAPAPPPEQATPDAPAQEPAVPVPQPQAPEPPPASDAAADERHGIEPATEPDPAPPAQRTAKPAQPPVAARPPPTPATDTDTETAEPTTLIVTMLSRGKGVPDEARAAYQDARALLEGRRDADIVTELRTQRIGLEGETRLCAEFRNAEEAQSALAEIRKRTAGIDLLDVGIAPCPSPKGKSP